MGCLLNFTADHLRDEFSSKLCKCACRGLALNNFSHLLADSSDLRRGGVCGLFDLIWTALGECNGKKAEEIVVRGLHCDIGLNQRLPLANQGPQFV